MALCCALFCFLTGFVVGAANATVPKETMKTNKLAFAATRKFTVGEVLPVRNRVSIFVSLEGLIFVQSSCRHSCW